MDALNLLLRRIIADPEDDTVRLAYADRLDELAEDAPRIECPSCHGRLHSFTYGACTKCSAVGTVPDTTLSDRAKFIRAGFAEYTKIHPEHVPKRRWAEWFPGLEDVSYVYDMEAYHGPGLVGILSRGFVAGLRGTAGAFLKNCDSLIWNEGQTLTCAECEGTSKVQMYTWDPASMEDRPSGKRKCGACVKGRVPRPLPSTAQPITTVRLTTNLDWDEGDDGGLYLFSAAPEVRRRCVVADTTVCGDYTGRWIPEILAVEFPGVAISFDLERPEYEAG